MDENLPNKNFFSNNFIVDIFLFLTAIISLLVTNLAIYLLCKHKVTQNFSSQSCLAASRRGRYSNNTGRGHYRMYLQNSDLYNFGINNYNFRPSDFCSSTLQKTKAVQRIICFSNAVKIMLFISDVQYYVPIKLCKTAGSIHLFKITGTLKPENIKLR